MYVPLTTAETVEALQTAFEEALVKWIVETSEAFHMVEHNSFKDIFSVANRYFTVSSWRSIQRRVLRRADSLRIDLREVFSDIERHDNLCRDAWSSSIYRGYLVRTAQLIDKKWKMREILLVFRRFPAPNTSIVDHLLRKQIEKWSPSTKMMSVTTEKPSDMTNTISKLHALLKKSYRFSRSTLSIFHVWCFADVTNVAIK